MTIKEFLLKKNIKQLALAKDLEINPSSLNKAINRWLRLPQHHEQKLCTLLKISMEEFINNDIKSDGLKQGSAK